MRPSPLWLFAHKALSPQFHENPARFVATLDTGAAPQYLERMWRWAVQASGRDAPAQPPLTYIIDRPEPGLAIVAMQFRDVTETGEPWQVRFVTRAPDASGGAIARMILLEHSAYASELDHAPRAIVCESMADGKHVNWGIVLPPDDEVGFANAVADKLAPATPVAQA